MSERQLPKAARRSKAIGSDGNLAACFAHYWNTKLFVVDTPAVLYVPMTDGPFVETSSSVVCHFCLFTKTGINFGSKLKFQRWCCWHHKSDTSGFPFHGQESALTCICSDLSCMFCRDPEIRRWRVQQLVRWRNVMASYDTVVEPWERIRPLGHQHFLVLELLQSSILDGVCLWNFSIF